MEKFKNGFYKVMMIVLLVMSLIATVGALGNFYQTNSDRLSPVVIILGVVVLILFFISLFSFLKNIKEKHKNIVAFVLCILFLLL